MTRTELDDWARDWMNTQLFNLTIMGGDFPGVEAIYRAGFERAKGDILKALKASSERCLINMEGEDAEGFSKWEGAHVVLDENIELLEKLGQGPARDGEQ